MGNAVVFLDRDGVIIKHVPDIHRMEDVDIFSFSPEAVRMLNKLHLLVIVVTNQPQVAKGYLTEEDLKKINQKIVGDLKKNGAKIDAVYYCPHHPDKGFPGERQEYKVECSCRKPKIGMIEEAAKRFDADLSKSFIVGDSTMDIKTGENVKQKYSGFKTILVKTGLGGKDGRYLVNEDFVVENLLDAAKLIQSIVKVGMSENK
jgi:histidinol-phosphate phosphatase family protein